MITSVGIQYAQPLFELIENRESTLESLKVLSKVVLDSTAYRVFSHPSISKEEKKSLIMNVLKDKIDVVFCNFVKVLIDNDRLLDLKEITNAYKDLVDKEKNILEVDVYTNYQLTSEEKNKVKQILKLKYQKMIIVNEHIDENMGGGIKITSQHEIIDITLLTKLNSLKSNIKKGW